MYLQTLLSSFDIFKLFLM